MSKELKTGIIAVVVIALFVWGYNFVKGQDIFNPGKRYFYIEYDNISGLNEASSVTINGLKVGKVSEIKFNADPSKRGKLLVKIIVENNFTFSKNSIAKIYPASLMGGQNLAIIPKYDDQEAVSGDFLKGVVEQDLIASIGDKLSPKIEHTIEGVDSLVSGVNQILDHKSRRSLNRSVIALEATISDVRKTLGAVNSILDNSKTNVEVTLLNAKKITDNFSRVSDKLAKLDVETAIQKVQATLENVNLLLDGIKKGNGTLGKLVNDEKMYTNLTKASKELEELLREMKLNPKRFVHFSLFGKKPKPYSKENNDKNISNQ